MPPLQPEHSLLLHDAETSAVRRVVAKIADAAARGDRVIHTHVDPAHEAARRIEAWVSKELLDRGAIQLVDAHEERRRSGGRGAELLAALRDRIAAAGADGTGVTVSTDTGALLTLAANADELVTLERGLHELAQEPGLTMLCCYPFEALQDRGEQLPAVLAGIHFERVHDVMWTSRTRGGLVCFEGELDSSNLDRVRSVLAASVDAGLHTIDLRAVTFLSPDAAEEFAAAALRSEASGHVLRLVRVPAVVERACELAGIADAPGLEIQPSEPPMPDDGRGRPGSSPSSLRVAEVFGELARLEEATTESEAASGLARIVKSVIATASDLSVTIGEPANPRVIDSSSQRAQHFDGLQMQAEEGPCQSAWETGSLVVTPDLRIDPRWPVFTELAGGDDLVSVLAMPVTSEDEVIGIINAYSPDPDAFGSLDLALAELTAYAVGQVLRHVNRTAELRELVENLRTALKSRSVIDQAKGILMARHGYDADAAFALLTEQSQRQNVKVRDLALLLTEEAVGSD